MQESLLHIKGKRITLTKGFHQSLAYLCWLAQDLERRPTRLYELVSLLPTLDGYHDPAGYIRGEAVLLGPTEVLQNLKLHPSAAKATPDPMGAHPIIWRLQLSEAVSASLVSW